MPLAETELASQPDRQHDKIAPKPKAPSQIEGFVEQHNYKWFFKASNAPVDPTQVEKVTVTVKLHAGHSADDGNRAVTSEVNRPAISPIVTVAAARRQRTPSWKSWVTQDSKTGKKLFLAKGLAGRLYLCCRPFATSVLFLTTGSICRLRCRTPAEAPTFTCFA